MRNIEIQRVNKAKNTVYFNAKIDEVFYYGMNIATNKEGGKFIGFPAQKSVDGKYYKHFYIPFTPEEEAYIIGLVEAKIG